MADKLEYVKFQERLEWAISLLKNKFPSVDESSILHEASEIARTLFVRSEINYSGKK